MYYRQFKTGAGWPIKCPHPVRDNKEHQTDGRKTQHLREASREPGRGRWALKPRERLEPKAGTLCVACREEHTGSRVTPGGEVRRT